MSRFGPGLNRTAKRAIWPALDSLLLLAIVALLVSDQTVIFFHLAFVGLLIGGLRLTLTAFAVRAVVVGPIIAVELFAAVQHGDTHVEELWEIPLMAALLLIAYRIRRQGDRMQADLDSTRFRVIAGVAHDVRNPLAAARGFAEIITANDGSLSPSQVDEMAHLIAESTLEAHLLIDDLLTAAQIEASGIEPARHHLDIAGLVTASVRQQHKGIDKITVRFPTGRALTGIGDELRVRQILRNLLSNAVRYGGPKIEVEADRTDDRVRIRVIDDGEGITERAVAHIFEPFVHGVGEKQEATSAGLGLYTSRHLAELMGGAVTYERIDGRTVFQLTLEAAPSDASRMSDRAASLHPPLETRQLQEKTGAGFKRRALATRQDTRARTLDHP